MISTIVQLLIAFPKIGALFLEVRREYIKELHKRRHNKHDTLIDEWVRDGEDEPNT